MKRILLLPLILCMLTINGFAMGFEEAEEEELNQNPLTAKIIALPDAVAPGQQIELKIALELVPHYHAYVDKFKLKWTGDEDVKIGKLNISPVTKFADTFSGKMKEGVKDAATARAIVEFPLDFALGEQKTKFQLTYQACTKKHCLFPKKIPLESDLLVSNDQTKLAASIASMEKRNTGASWAELKKSASGSISFSDVAGKGLFFSLIVIFLAGILTSFTPCVYPMIPITLAVIGAKSKDSSQNRLQSFSLSLVYVLGIAAMFSSLGVFAALTGSLFGTALSHPAVAFALAGVFVIMGLSMFGLFEIQAPAFMRDKLGASGKSGYVGAFGAGLVSGIIAGPCVGPVLVGVLAHVGAKQSVSYGFLLLFTYAMGMGLLFLAIGTFSGIMQKLPRAGRWMELSKFVFGSTMIGMAIYYIKPFTNDSVYSIVLGLTLIAISSVYGAFLSSPKDALDKLRKGALMTAFYIGVIYVAFGLFEKQLTSITPAQAVKTESVSKKWTAYSDQLLAQAKADGKPAIVDFYADWCVACKELEKYTFTHDEFKELADNFVLLKFDATESSPEVQRLTQKYKVLGLPTILFINSSGEVMEDLTLTGFEEGPEFAARMRKTLN